MLLSARIKGACLVLAFISMVLSLAYFNQFGCQGYYIIMKLLNGNESVSKRNVFITFTFGSAVYMFQRTAQ